MLEESQLSKIAEGLLATYQLDQFDIDLDKAHQNLLSELRDEYANLNSDSTKSARCEYFSIDGTLPTDYSEHLVLLEDGPMICGIRHFGGNRNWPFVLLQPSFPIDGQMEAKKIFSFVEDHFSVFKPKHICVHSNREIGPNMRGASVYTQLSDIIAKLPAWDKEEALEFKNPDEDSYYPWYQDQYSKFHDSNPNLKDKVPVNDKEVMEDSRTQNLLKMIYFEKKLIGLIAAEESPFLGHSGIYFSEIFLSEDVRGKGMAKAVQRKFVQDFCSSYDFIWGTIDAFNRPSSSTAVRNLRHPIRFENFFTT